MNTDNIAIKIENISKCYRIGLKENLAENFAESIFSFIKSPLKNYRQYRSLYKFDDTSFHHGDNSNIDPPDIIWALKDVSFEVKRGTVLGIIGRNGAGKSTLLKILSKITHPTRGSAKIRGRFSSLLEVGTGFHQELTGRENVYLNGTVLGMKKIEVDRKFDEIVDFSGVEKFIDTPVKRYSSGMIVRLAFSVAAHLNTDVMMIDEVLAVGDVEFQKKCLGKMGDAGREGRTVLLVSHNLSAVTSLCDRAILLDGGKVREDGQADRVVSAYLNSEVGTSSVCEWLDPSKAPGGDVARLRSVRVLAHDGSIRDDHDIRLPIRVEMKYDVLKSGSVLLPNFHFFNELGVELFGTVDLDPQWRGRARPAGQYISTVELPGNLLSEGWIIVGAALITLDPVIVQFNESEVVALTVVDSYDGDSARGDYYGVFPGAMRPLLNWNTKFYPNSP
jgi:lipopolysaccharide transport system ATP-binding protein